MPELRPAAEQREVLVQRGGAETSPAATLRRFWNLTADGELDEAISLLDPQGSFWSRPIGEVPMSIFMYIYREMFLACPIRFDIRSDMQRDGRAILEMTGSGVFSTTGEIYENAFVFVADVRSGAITRLHEYNDSAYAREVFARSLDPAVLATYRGMIAAHSEKQSTTQEGRTP